MTSDQWVDVLRKVVPFVKGELVTVTFGSADAAFYIGHGLGANPYYVVVNQDRAGSIYKNPVDEQPAKQLVLRSSTASLTATLLLWEV